MQQPTKMLILPPDCMIAEKEEENTYPTFLGGFETVLLKTLAPQYFI